MHRNATLAGVANAGPHTATMSDQPHFQAPLWLQHRLLLAASGLLAAMLLLAAFGFVSYQRRELQQDALARSELFAHVLEDQANRSIGSVEIALAAAADGISALPGQHGQALVSPILERSALTLPYLRSLSLVDAQGRVLASSNPANLERAIPRHHLLGAVAVPGLGPLLPGRDLADLGADTPTPTAWLLPLVRPVEAPTQTAHQTAHQTEWLVATIDPTYFAAQYAQLLGDAPQRAALLSLGGQLIAGSRGIGLQAGQRSTGHRVFTEFLPGRGQGQFAGTGLDGQPSFGAFRTAKLQPLVLLVETPQATVSAQIDRMALTVAAVAGSLLLLLGVLGTLAWRNQRSREAVSGDLAAARDSIAAHDAFTDRLFQVSPIPMVVKDTHGRFLRVNKAWTDLTGLPYERVIGVSLGRLYPAQLAAPHMVQEQMAIASGQPVNYEEQILDSDGLPRDVMIRVMPYTDAEGQVSGVITCLTDVTEFREAALRTLEAKDAAEHANYAKSEFLANISHELRTPLQGILGFSELGGQRSRVDARVQGMFGDIHSAGERMLTLVNNLLDLSRLESTVGEVHLVPMDIVPPLQAVVAELRQMAGQQGLQLAVTADEVADRPAPPTGRGAGLWAAADGFRLQQVLRNVLANAIRFAPRGSEIQIDWRYASSHELMISVRDHGPGIPTAELERIFESFVQSSRTKDGSGGTGLGLAICRKIMAAHRGRISARNHAEGGAVFEVVLPALHRQPAATNQRSAAHHSGH